MDTGRYIRFQNNNLDNEQMNNFMVVDPTTEANLKTNIERILAITPLYSNVVRYIESKMDSLVAQAMVASIQQHFLEYMIVITKMEELLLHNHNVFLQKIFCMLLPYNGTFQMLNDLTVKFTIENGKNTSKYGSGLILTILHEKLLSMAGLYNNAHNLCLKLIADASVPYFETLKMWIYSGKLIDPQCEFFIYINNEITDGNDDDYDEWDLDFNDKNIDKYV